MAEKVKIVGGTLDGAQLENAASEATLLLLKEAMNKLANIQNVAANRSTRDITRLGGSAGGAADEIDELGGSISLLGAPLKLVTGGFNLLSKGIGSLLGAVSAGTNSLVKFSANMIDSQPNITDFTEAIADSKLNVLGLGTALDAATKILYGNYTTFQDLAKSGFQLGSQVSQLTGDITANRLTLSEFSQIARENSENLAMFGNATFGLNKFLKMNSAAFATNRNILQNWGITFSEQGELFADFLGQNAYALRRGTRTQAEVTALSADYATTLLKISGITGKTLKQMQEDLAKQNLNSAFKSFLDTLPADEAAKVNAMILAQQQQFGQDAADLAMAQMMSMPPLTEGSRIMASLMPGLTDNIQNQIDAAKNSGMSLDEYASTIMRENGELARASEPLMASYRNTAFALDAQGSALGSTMQSMIGNVHRTAIAFEDLNKPMDPTAQAIATFDTVVSNLRSTMGGWFTAFFTNPEVQSGLTKMTTWLAEFDPLKYNPFDEEGRKNIYDAFWTAVNAVTTTMSGWWNGPTGIELRNTISDFFAGLVQTIQDMFVNSTTLNTLLGIDREEVAYRQATTGANIDVENAITAALGDGFWNMSEVAGVQSVGGQETLDQLVAQLGDQADNYGSTNAQIEAALRVLGEKYDAGTASAEERALFAKSIANLTDPNANHHAVDAEAAGMGTYNEFGGYVDGYTYNKDGTSGFQNFGTETISALHGVEAVVPRNTMAGNMLATMFGDNWNNPKDVKQPSQSQDNTGKYIMQLNNTMLLVLEELRKSNNLEKKTLNSVKGLSGDLFRGM